jgi:tRNA threonylcarbamoyl adenosine modification protein (Sua5/YciO/YrdC/YwlC family)
MSERYDCTDPAQRAAGIAGAATSLRKGDLVVMPTDTVYGLAADAFSPPAVTSLLAAKGRGRQMPPPVLVGTVRAATALVEGLNQSGKDLIEEFWPGGLTLVLRANRNLLWDLGDTKGTVAVRMPLNELALDLLKETGPLAVSSANLSGAPPATTAAAAQEQLGDAVAVYLDGGPCPGDVPSTIVDLTGPVPRLLRPGVISVERLRQVVTLAVDDEALEGQDTAPPPAADAGSAGDAAPTDEDAAPGAGDAAPTDEDAALGAGDAAPTDEDAAPRAGDAAPTDEDAASPAGKAAAPDEDAAPSDEDAGPLAGDAAPRGNTAAPAGEDAAPAE